MFSVLPEVCVSDHPPKRAADIQVPEMVQRGQYYRVLVQVGPDTSWRNIRGVRQWKRREGTAPGKPELHDPQYVVAEAICDANETNGLIQETAEWVNKNRRGTSAADPNSAGCVNRMMAVIDVQPTDFKPQEFSVMNGNIPAEMLAAFIQQINQKAIQEAVNAAIKEALGGK